MAALVLWCVSPRMSFGASSHEVPGRASGMAPDTRFATARTATARTATARTEMTGTEMTGVRMTGTDRISFPAGDRARIARLLDDRPAGRDMASRLDWVSAKLLGTPYLANTLIGGPEVPEALVIRLDGVDCYTFIDLARALALARDTADFIPVLKQTRYRDAQVQFDNRRHFLTDWVAFAPRNARDITATLSPHARHIRKRLNLRADGGHYIPGLPVRSRDVTFLPPQAVTPEVLDGIRTGDVIGIYTALDGLDVTHTGLAIRKRDETGREDVYFRNASSLKANRKVVDTRLVDYVRNKPGIVVLRMTGMSSPGR